MADILTWKNSANVAWSTVETPGTDVGELTDVAELEYDQTLSDGVGASQADVLWRERRTILTANAWTYDLQVLTQSMFGYATSISLLFVGLKGMLIVNEALVSGDVLTLTNAAANSHLDMFHGADATLEIPPNSAIKVSNKIQGWAVAGTTRKLKITNTGPNSITYRIVFVGTTA